jgi:hypothetical protein
MFVREKRYVTRSVDHYVLQGCNPSNERTFRNMKEGSPRVVVSWHEHIGATDTRSRDWK